MSMTGIDIGGTNIKSVRLDAAGRVLGSSHAPTPAGAAELAERVALLLREVATPAGEPVGIAAPGLVDADNRAIRWMRGRLEAVQGLDWSQQLGRCVRVLNDAHAALLAEAWLGAAAGKRHAIMLTLGTGVGGAAIVDGQLLQGAIGRAGHLGHITLDRRGQGDIVGTPGSLEDLVGAHTLGEQSGGRYASIAALVEAVHAGDAAAQRLWEERVHALACGIASLINAFDPELVVLGGGGAAAGPALFDRLGRWLEEMEWRPLGEAVPVVAASLGDKAGAIGAARFAATWRDRSDG